MSLSKHKSHNYETVQMVCWLSLVSPKLYQATCAGSNPVWGNFLLFFPQLFFYCKFIPAKINKPMAML